MNEKRKVSVVRVINELVDAGEPGKGALLKCTVLSSVCAPTSHVPHYTYSEAFIYAEKECVGVTWPTEFIYFPLLGLRNTLQPGSD